MSSHTFLLQAIMNTSGKIILCSFSSPQKNFCSVFFCHVGIHFLLRQSERVSINPLEFPSNFLFMPWLFSLELLHLWVMEKIRTITEGFSAAKRRLDRKYDLHYRPHLSQIRQELLFKASKNYDRLVPLYSLYSSSLLLPLIILNAFIGTATSFLYHFYRRVNKSAISFLHCY